MEHISLINHLRITFINDTVSLFYHGDFSDFYTDKIISIIQGDAQKKLRGRLSFVMAESFQNVVRHKDDTLSHVNHNVFGIRGNEDFVHIFSSNLVSESVKNDLKNKIDDVNALDKEGLKKVYLKILESGELNEKGGAGMGLIEMARKSNNPIQFEFAEIDESYAFNMQIDFDKKTKDSNATPITIAENSLLCDLIHHEEILFIYNGEFGDNVLEPMIPIVESNTATDNQISYNIFHVAIELMQNIGRHAVENKEGNRKGIFALKKIEDGFYLCSGNYTEENPQELIEHVDRLNKMSLDELNELYKVSLKESVKYDTNSARVGLIDIRRTSLNHIDLQVSEDANGKYVMFGVKITSN